MSKRDHRRHAARRDEHTTVLFDPHQEPDHAGHRHGRLRHLLSEELAALLRDDVGDPLLRGLRVAAMELSVDYGHARVLVAPPEPTGRDGARRIESALVRAAGYLRAQLIHALDLKRVPCLSFRCEQGRSP